MTDDPRYDARAELATHQETFDASLRRIATILQEADHLSPVLMPALVAQLVVGTAAFMRQVYELDPEQFMAALLVDVRRNLGTPVVPQTIDWTARN